MRFEATYRHLHGVPYIKKRNARRLYDFILENKLTSILELGFGHGTASCYMAAALDELGGGKLVSVDLAKDQVVFKPTIEEQLDKTNLAENVDIFRETTGYSWFLRNEIRANSKNYQCTPKYHLCIIDGPKNWTIDGHAFFCVDKLLKDGGWLIFDDYAWTYASEARRQIDTTDGITHRQLSDEELNTPHIQEVLQLLVMQHPNYSNFRIDEQGDWAWAQKAKSDTRTLTVEYKEATTGAIPKLNRLHKRLRKRLSKRLGA